MTKNAEWQMKHHRNVTSDKQQLKAVVDKAYVQASSQKKFYTLLQEQGLELYTQRGVIRGIKGKRKFRFKTLGFDREILKLLDKKVTKNVRLEALRKMREEQQEHSLGKERTRKRGR